jgi:hypothetical protein
MSKPFDILAAVKKRRDACVQFKDGKPAKDRREAMDFYRGKNLALYGDSGSGLSTVVSRDTMEAIESMMPPLLRPFVAGEEVVSFDPVEQSDEESTKQSTAYINHVFRRDNNVLAVAQTALKDGLLLRDGIAKTVWEECEAGPPEAFEGVTAEELEATDQSRIAGDVSQDPETGMHSFTLAPKKTGKYRVYIIAPDEFLREERLASMEAGSFFGHRKEIRVGDLIAQGIDPAKAAKLTVGRPESTDESDARFEDEENFRPDGGEWANDDLARPVWVDECYIRCDYDGTGVLSWRKVMVGGANNVLLSDEACDDHPYSHWTPIPIPHKLTGMSMHDLTRDVQMNKTAIQREINNAMYLANRPQREVVEGQVNIDDLLQPAVGGIVRVKQKGAINSIATGGEVAFAAGFQAIEYLDGVREARTGVTRYNQGMDANSLNKTATGMNIISGNSQQRQELVARQFGEFLKDIFEKILALVAVHSTPEEVVRLTSAPFVPWPTQYDTTVSVGLGTNNKDQQVAHLTQLMQIDAQIIQFQQGLNGPLITAENVYEKLKDYVQAMGIKNNRYYTDPAQAEQQQQPQQPPGPSPDAQLKAQTDLQKEDMRQHGAVALEHVKQMGESARSVVPINSGMAL